MRYLGHEAASGPFPIPVGVCTSEKQWRKAVADLGCPDEPWPSAEGCVSRFRQPNGAQKLIVSFRFAEGRTLIKKTGMVAHEATHVWQFMRQAMAEEAPGWEIEACAVQWITQWLLERLEAKGTWK